MDKFKIVKDDSLPDPIVSIEEKKDEIIITVKRLKEKGDE